MNANKLPISFYQRSDVVQIAKELLGKKIVTNINNQITSGIIVETEAYRAPEDSASHAFNNRQTKRTLTFYKEGGIAYVYLIYGVYKLFNIITNIEGVPHAVLIRAIEPLQGIDTMLKRRNMSKLNPKITAGPGVLSMALGIDMAHNEETLNGPLIWLENAPNVEESQIIASPRVGLGKTIQEPYFSMPWRFRIKNNPYTSLAK